MTIERLEEIELGSRDAPDTMIGSYVRELITECKRLRSELNEIQGKAKEALDG